MPHPLQQSPNKFQDRMHRKARTPPPAKVSHGMPEMPKQLIHKPFSALFIFPYRLAVNFAGG
jgi:hypothetical protein